MDDNNINNNSQKDEDRISSSFNRKSRDSLNLPRDSLEHILEDKRLSELFHDWAAENLCSENLMFYYEVLKYQTIHDPHLMKGEAARIYAKYIQPGAVAQVNLDYECLVEIETEIEHPTSHIFNDAKFMVTDLIRFDLYQKFLNSDIYRQFKGLPTPRRLRFPRKRSNFHIAEMPHLTFEQISNLSNCLTDETARAEFLKFAYGEFSDGVVQFYLDVDQYELCPSLEFACQIYNKYLGEEPEEEVDADPKIKRRIWQQIQSGQCPQELFHTLKIQTYAVMVQDNFLRFQNHVISSLALV